MAGSAAVIPKNAPLACWLLAVAILGAAPVAWQGRPLSFSRYRGNDPSTAARGSQVGKASPGPILGPSGGETQPWSVLEGLVEGAAPAVRRPPSGVPPALGDLLARVPRPDYWRDPMDPSCPVTWAHEATHGMTSELSRGGGWSMYLLEGRAIRFSGQPSVTIGQVAAAIPADQRGPIFDLYLVKQRGDWDGEPLYLLDEWNAYVHGSLARRQAGLSNRQETERYAREMERYCRAMLGVVRQRDPDYADLHTLQGFIEWQSRRFDQVVGGASESP